MPRTIYDSLQGKPLSIEVTFALTQAREAGTHQMAVRKDDFAVPGIGICSGTTFLDHPDEIRGLACRAPLHQPDLTLVHGAWSDGPCNAEPSTAATIQSDAWTGILDHGPAEFGIVPMWSSQIDFSNQYRIERNRVLGLRTLCPGTPLTFTRYALAGRSRAGFTISGFHFPHLVRGEVQAVWH